MTGGVGAKFIRTDTAAIRWVGCATRTELREGASVFPANTGIQFVGLTALNTIG
jgi:hypothetical protein